MLTVKEFGRLNDGTIINEYTFKNSQGTIAKIINYGAILRSFQLADSVELTLGFDTLEDYLTRNHAYFGVVVGRVAGRIAKAQFKLHTKVYQLAKNHGEHHIHGGIRGFNAVVWEPEIQDNILRLNYLSFDGEEGYPGRIKVVVEYQLTDQNELIIEYKAEADRATPINLTHHGYWNLSGVGQDVLNHEIQIFSNRYLELDKELIPTGNILPVENTVFDFTERTRIGDSIQQAFNGYGYDQCYDLDNLNHDLKLAANVWEPHAKRNMKVFTNQPGVQFYTGNSIKQQVGANGKVFDRFGGFCLETQNFPDAINQPSFPDSVLQPEKAYYHKTIYQILNI